MADNFTETIIEVNYNSCNADAPVDKNSIETFVRLLKVLEGKTIEEIRQSDDMKMTIDTTDGAVYDIRILPPKDKGQKDE